MTSIGDSANLLAILHILEKEHRVLSIFQAVAFG